MAMSRSRGSSVLTTRSPISIVPAVTSSSPATMRSSVDLPQPEGPTITMNSRLATSSEMPWMTGLRPEILRPAIDEEDDEERRDIGGRERQQDVLEEAPGTGAVDARCLEQLIGNGHEELAEEQGRGRRRDERDDEAGIGVDQLEI